MENKIIKFNDSNEMRAYICQKFDDVETDIILIGDYEMAKFMSFVYDDEDFLEYYSIDIASDIGEYIIYKDTDKVFIIEPAKIDKKWLESISDILLVQGDLLDNELLIKCEFTELEILEIKEDFEEEDCCCECCDCEDRELVQEELNDMLNEYTLLIQETNGCEECIKNRLAEFAIDILENFQLDDR